MRTVAVVLSLALLSSACGDYSFDPGGTIANGSPAGSTTVMGTVSVAVDGQPFSAVLPTGATYTNGRFGFGASNSSGLTRTIALSVRAPGPGTFDAASSNRPIISYIEDTGSGFLRWFLPFRAGAGSVTLSFITTDRAAGEFTGELEPDSATAAAGVTERRFLTGGTFSVSMSR